MVFYVIMNLQKLQDVSQSDIKSFNGKVDLKEVGPVRMMDTDFRLFFVLKKQSMPYKLPKEKIFRYINIEF